MTNAEQTAAIEEMQQQIAALQAENADLAVQIDVINLRIAPIAPQLQPDLVVVPDEMFDVDGDKK
jgi:uncharacterized coiled-coil protein SlyX